MDEALRTWECLNCGFVYSEAEGLPEDGIPAGTRWADIPEDFACPTCGFEKAQFNMVAV